MLLFLPHSGRPQSYSVHPEKTFCSRSFIHPTSKTSALPPVSPVICHGPRENSHVLLLFSPRPYIEITAEAGPGAAPTLGPLLVGPARQWPWYGIAVRPRSPVLYPSDPKFHKISHYPVPAASDWPSQGLLFPYLSPSLPHTQAKMTFPPLLRHNWQMTCKFKVYKVTGDICVLCETMTNHCNDDLIFSISS